MAEQLVALQVKDADNVATIFADDVIPGTVIAILDPSGIQTPLTVRDAIPYGHKVAVRPIAVGELIIKYGEEIGVATHDIAAGAYVHVHNLDSMRGRGDLERMTQEGVQDA